MPPAAFYGSAARDRLRSWSDRVAEPWWLVAAVSAGYGFAWAGHFFFEHNRPTTFTHPVYSFMGDWAMFRDMLTGRIRW